MKKIFLIASLFSITATIINAQPPTYCVTVQKVNETPTILTVKFFLKITSPTPVIADVSLILEGVSGVSGRHIVAGSVNTTAGQSLQIFNPEQNPTGTYDFKVQTFGAVNFSLDDITLKGLGVYIPTKVAKEANCSINSLSILPLAFSATKVEDKALLVWETQIEENLSYFAIERSSDAQKFTQIGFVKAVGNSRSLQKYSFTDELPLSGTNYYRLNIVQDNGNREYSKMVNLKFTKPLSAKVYPNPFDGELTVDLYIDRGAGEVLVELVDELGRILYLKKIQTATDNLNIVLPISDFPVGAYILRAKNGADIWQQKVTKF